MKYGLLLCEDIKECELINEKWGAFEGQYDLSKEISNVLYDMLLKNENKRCFHTKHNKIQMVDLSYVLDIYSLTPQGVIKGLNSENGKLIMEFKIPPKIIVMPKDKVIKMLINVVTHELMHGYIFLKRIEHNVNQIEDAPDYYDKLIDILQYVNNNSILYKFAYGLYSIYYQESNAIISQTSEQIRILLNGKEKTNNNIRNALKETESYIIYYNILVDLIPFIRKMSNEEIIEKLINPLKNYGIFFSIKDINKKCKLMKIVAEHSINSIIKNAMFLKYEIS